MVLGVIFAAGQSTRWETGFEDAVASFAVVQVARLLVKLRGFRSSAVGLRKELDRQTAGHHRDVYSSTGTAGSEAQP